MIRRGESPTCAAYDDACRRVDALVEQFAAPTSGPGPVDIVTGGEPRVTFESNFTQAAFEQAVERCQEYIRAGDIFQVVLSQRLKTRITAPPFEIYRTLRVVNPSPFMFYLRTPHVTLVGSSPEILVRVMHGEVTVRPLAGTRPRGATDEEDRRLAEELLADPKERAEHVMLVDLGRNDVGRVARYGSVELSDVMTVERYSHVMHITSNVTGQLSPGATRSTRCGRACRPERSRCAEGAGHADHRRARTAPARAIRRGGGLFRFRRQHGYLHRAADARDPRRQRLCASRRGLVADSVPAAEYQETLNKARGLLKAIEITERRMADEGAERGGCALSASSHGQFVAFIALR